MVHKAIEYGRAHRIVAQVGAPVLHDTIGGDDDAAMQFVALMDQGLQQCAGIVGNGAGEEQIVQYEQITVDDVSQPDLALCDGAQRVAMKKSSVSIYWTLWLCRIA